MTEPVLIVHWGPFWVGQGELLWSQPGCMTEGAESAWDLLSLSPRLLPGHSTSKFEGK